MVRQQLTRTFAVLLVTASLAACSTAPLTPSSPAPPPATTPDRPAPTPVPSNAATLALLEDSAAADAAGDYQRAVGYLERAIRISPRDAQLWVALARQHVNLGRWQLGKQQAQKAIQLAGSQLNHVRDAWLVIADAEEGLGNTRRARQIRSEWQTARG